VWSTILSSNIGMATQFRALSFDARGRAALALAETGVRTEELLGYAEQSATELASLGLPCSAPHAHLLRAGVEAIRGNAPEALSLLGSAEEALVGDEGSPLTAMVVRRLRGFIQGQPRRVHEADGHLRIAGVRDPAAWARLYAPGFGALTR
jgi:hypothetical protein